MDGFTKLHEFGLNEHLKLIQTVKHDTRWSPLISYLAHGWQPLYGWTRGIRWRKGSSFIQFDLGRESMAILQADPLIDTYGILATSEGFAIKLALLVEEFADDFSKQTVDTAELAHMVTDIREAFQGIKKLSYRQWYSSLKSEELSDPLIQLLAEKYKTENDALLLSFYTTILSNILFICKARGVRFVSLSERDFVVFEDVRTSRLPFGKPMAGHIAEIIGIGGNIINGPQTQVGLWGKLDDERFGTYDLRGPAPVRVTGPLNFTASHTFAIERVIDEDISPANLKKHMIDCGATL